MKLATARAFPLRLGFTRPLVTALGEFTTRESVVLEVCDADGGCGHGEAAPWRGFGGETLAAAQSALERAIRLLEKRGAGAQEWPLELVTLLAETPAAHAAVEGALCDLAARLAGQPLAAFLRQAAGLPDAAAPAAVAVNALLVEREPEALRAEAARARAAGYRAAKLKVATGPLVEDIARVRAARDGLGPQVALRLDANGAWSEAQAREGLDALAAFRPDYVEQPVAAADLAAMARLRASGGLRIAADESLAARGGLAQVLGAGACDVVVLKPSLLGGPLAALAAARRAREAGCTVVFTHAFESAVGRLHALHCAAAWDDPQAVHGLSGGTPFRDDLAALPAVEEGRLPVPDGPGLGLVLETARLQAGEDA